MRGSECDRNGSAFASRDASGMAGYADSIQEWILMLDSPVANRQPVSGNCANTFLEIRRQA